MKPTRLFPRSRPIALAVFAALVAGPVVPTAWADAVCSLWPDGTICRPVNPCLGNGTCQAGDCVSNTPAPAGSTCHVSADPCQADSACDGSGTCVPGPLRPAGTVCQDSSNPCLGNKVCDAMGQCVAGSMLPPGTICRISLNPCVSDNVCDVAGQCVAGSARAMGTTCLDPTPCRDAGTCNGAGVCNAGPPANDGRPCIGNNICQSTACQGGSCVITGTRDCSMGDPCRKRDSCMPGVGCIVVNICDMRPVPDLSGDLSATDLAMSMPDLRTTDGGPADLTSSDAPPQVDGPLADLTMSPIDARGLDLRTPVDAAGRDQAASAPDPGYHLPTSLTGGACQCRLGRGEAPTPLSLLALALLLRLRRRRPR